MPVRGESHPQTRINFQERLGFNTSLQLMLGATMTERFSLTSAADDGIDVRINMATRGGVAPAGLSGLRITLRRP